MGPYRIVLVFLIFSEMLRQEFQCNSALQASVVGEIDFAHPARAELAHDPVVIDYLAHHHAPENYHNLFVRR
jgi:hypothetical protein